MPEIELMITNKAGLHARPASLFVQEASKYQSEITVMNGNETADAKSILDLLTLGVNKGCTIRITAEGSDAVQALDALKALHASNFGEKE